MVKEEKQKKEATSSYFPIFPKRAISILAEEVAQMVVSRLPHMPRSRRKKLSAKKISKIEHGLFLDTSAIIDGRIFEVLYLGLVTGGVVILESILLELKHIADSQDAVKRERGRNGLQFLEKLKKSNTLSVVILSEDDQEKYANMDIKEVDEKLIRVAKAANGRIVTCDYNLEKKASIQGVPAVNVNALANSLKIRAVPGDALHIKVLHQGKDSTQGVGYLDDGTMIVVEHASEYIGKTLDVVVARVIQTASGRILFAKKI